MKKMLRMFLALTVGLGIFAGCGSTTTPTSTDKTAGDNGSAAATSKPTVTITYREDGAGESSPMYKWFQRAIDTYAKKDEVNIKIEPIQASEGDYFAKIALQLNSDNPPTIVTEDTFQLPNDVAAGYLTDLSDYVKSYEDWNNGSYYESIKNGVTVDGKTYGIPYTTDTRGLWYNKEIFKAAGLPEVWEPKNWEEIFTTLETIKTSNPDIVPFWCNSAIATGEATSMQTYEMLLYATGERLMDENEEKWVIKSPNIIKSLEFIDKIYKKELGPPLSLVLNGQASNTSAREYLPQGKLAVSLDGNWIAGNYVEGSVSPWADYDKALGFAAFPTNEGQEPLTMTLAGGWGLAIPEKAKNKDIAFDFIKHCMEPDVYIDYPIMAGGIATREDAAKVDKYATLPFKLQATEFLASAEFRPKNDKYSSVSTCIQEMVESVASGSSTPEQAMNKYATDVTRIVGSDNVVEK